MIEVQEARPGFAAVHVDGKIDRDDIDLAIAAVEKARDGDLPVDMFVSFGRLASVSGEAFLRDLRYGLELLRQRQRFGRAAVVADQDWLRGLASFEGALIPGLRLRTFKNDARDEAWRWVTQPEPAGQPEPPGVQLFATGKPGIVGYEVTGPIHADDMAAMLEPLHDAYQAYGKVKLFGRIRHWDGFDAGLILDRRVWSIKLEGFRHVSRYAVVGGPAWFARWIALIKPLSRVEVRHFPLEQEAAAWTWLEADDRRAPPADAQSVQV